MDYEKQIQYLTNQNNRNITYYHTAYNWLYLLESGIDLSSFFEFHQCKKIAIYGIADFGKMLQKEMEQTGNVDIVYFMDRNAEQCRMIGNIPVYLPEELPDLPEVDMMVVTAIAAFPNVNKLLLEIKPELPVVSLNMIIDNCLNDVWFREMQVK
ncbi:MAG: hypothetical protein HFI89_01785 [Lachnospiraceae bacterium]|nr:hypothetical protein [Lachnospiraceae bacterium]